MVGSSKSWLNLLAVRSTLCYLANAHLVRKPYDVIKWKNVPRYWPVTGHRWIPRTKASLRLNKPLGKQSWGWWFETLSRSLWRHYNETSQHGNIVYNTGPAAYGGLSSQRASDTEFFFFVVLSMNNMLNKQQSNRGLEMSRRSCDITVMAHVTISWIGCSIGQ